VALARAARGWLAAAIAGCVYATASPSAGGVDAGAGESPRAAAAAPELRAKHCPLADVSPSSTAPTPVHERAVDPAPRLSSSDAEPGALTLRAVGPVLDYLYSRAVTYDIECTAEGFVVDASIVQLSDQRLGALKNILWRPALALRVSMRRPSVRARVVWRLRLPSAAALTRGETPPYPAQAYPAETTIVLVNAQPKKK
jgi:hypothetical protein